MQKIILILQLILMWSIACGAWLHLWQINLLNNTVLELFGILTEIIGCVILAFAYWSLRPSFTIHVRPKGALIINGIYRYSRNPIYLAALLMSLGWTLFFRSCFCFIGTSLLFFVLSIKIKMEERELEKKFGQTYLEYRAQTSRWAQFLPSDKVD
jgi:protein-S-isoprenylcysteine O-methyltransferase Ste14